MLYIENLESLVTGNKNDEVVIVNIPYQNFVYRCVLLEDVVNQKANELLKEKKLKIKERINKNIANIISLENPTIDYNPPFKYFKWFNVKTNEMFECTNNKKDDNIWVGNQGTVIMNVPPMDKVDIFGDGSGIALFKFNKNVIDISGKYKGKIIGGIKYVEGKENLAVQSTGGQIKISNLPFDKNSEAANISFWFKWNGRQNVMPIGWNVYDLYVCSDGDLGFNTANGDNYGVNIKKYKNKWIHVSANFKKFQYGEIFINGKKQILKQNCGKINKYRAILNKNLYIFGWGRDSGYRLAGVVDDVRIFTRGLSEKEAEKIYYIQGV